MENKVIVEGLAGLGSFRKGDEILDRIGRFVVKQPRLELAFCSIKYGIHIVRHVVIVAKTWTKLLLCRFPKIPMIRMSSLLLTIRASRRGPTRGRTRIPDIISARSAGCLAGWPWSRIAALPFIWYHGGALWAASFLAGAIGGYWNYVAVCRVADRLAQTGAHRPGPARLPGSSLRLLFIGVAVFVIIRFTRIAWWLHSWVFLRRSPL